MSSILSPVPALIDLTGSLNKLQLI